MENEKFPFAMDMPLFAVNLREARVYAAIVVPRVDIAIYCT